MPLIAGLRGIRFNARAALVCLPALAMILGTGLWSGHYIAASIAAGGALAVGFGSIHPFTDWRAAAMVCAAIGMAMSTLFGSMLGGHAFTFMLVCAIWAAGCSILASIEFGAWWILLQWSIALFVAGSYPGDIEEASWRSGLVLAGGLIQVLCVLAGWRLGLGQPPAAAHHSLTRLNRILTLIRLGRFPSLRHALGAALAVMLALAAISWLSIPNGYWAPMTVLLVLKPTLSATTSRGWQRLSGTLLGGLLASAVSLMPVSQPVLLVLALLCAWAAFGLQGSDYIAFTAAITATVVLLIALGHQPEIVTALHRLAATLLGGTLALAVAFATEPGYLDKYWQKWRKP